MDLLPESASGDLASSLANFATENALILIGVTGLALGVRFVMGFFFKTLKGLSEGSIIRVRKY